MTAKPIGMPLAGSFLTPGCSQHQQADSNEPRHSTEQPQQTIRDVVGSGVGPSGYPWVWA